MCGAMLWTNVDEYTYQPFFFHDNWQLIPTYRLSWTPHRELPFTSYASYYSYACHIDSLLFPWNLTCNLKRLSSVCLFACDDLRLHYVVWGPYKRSTHPERGARVVKRHGVPAAPKPGDQTASWGRGDPEMPAVHKQTVIYVGCVSMPWSQPRCDAFFEIYLLHCDPDITSFDFSLS